jgi:toxin-antitoxin system PIN domain toxin
VNVIDANVLLALYRADHAHHELASTWWQESSDSGEPFTVPDLMWVAFARIATNRHIFPVPATFDQAWQFADAVMRQPRYLTFAGDVNTVSEFARVGRDAGAAGNLVTDAYLAATASTLGATVVTFDRDFRRFNGVRVNELRT